MDNNRVTIELEKLLHALYSLLLISSYQLNLQELSGKIERFLENIGKIIKL